jgi:hypothetical protein
VHKALQAQLDLKVRKDHKVQQVQQVLFQDQQDQLAQLDLKVHKD